MDKKVLGLDLGTNSIGWALVNYIKNADTENFIPSEIIDLGSRIIPMADDAISKFNDGSIASQTAQRTAYRGVRRLLERHKLRRERLHRVLNILGFLPQHYAEHIDFITQSGKFISDAEPKIAYCWDVESNKFEFYFKQSFGDMMLDFSEHQPELVENGKKVPYDWTIYYLRKKALTHKVTKEELAWLLLHFNQKRGYYEQRGEEEELNEVKEYHLLKVLKVEDSGDRKGDAIWYNVYLENGDIYRRTSKLPLNWEGETKEFIISYKIDKEGNEKRSYSSPTPDNWNLVKKRTENEIEKSGKTVGAYIYDTLLKKPDQKIRGKLIQTIGRNHYIKELEEILKTQIKFHPELQDAGLYNSAIENLYPSNVLHKNIIRHRGFSYLFVEDIIYYHRPLKSKKHLISECQYEYYVF